MITLENVSKRFDDVWAVNNYHAGRKRFWTYWN